MEDTNLTKFLEEKGDDPNLQGNMLNSRLESKRIPIGILTALRTPETKEGEPHSLCLNYLPLPY